MSATTTPPCPLCRSPFPQTGGDDKVKCTNPDCYLSKPFIWVPREQWESVQTLSASSDLLEALKRSNTELIAERDSLYDCHANPDTGKVEDEAGKQGLAELDAIIDVNRAVIAEATSNQS